MVESQKLPEYNMDTMPLRLSLIHIWMIVSTEACLPLMMIRMIANPSILPKKAERVMTYGLVIIKRSEERVMPAPVSYTHLTARQAMGAGGT